MRDDLNPKVLQRIIFLCPCECVCLTKAGTEKQS
jgi:hypothetical protein